MSKKKILIVVLSVLIVVMAVGYALLAQELTINGSASIDSTWRVEITDIKEVSKVGEANTISTDYTATTASFSNVLVHPGDKITYEITVTNKGSLDAVLEDYTIDSGDNDAIVLETDKGKGYYKGIKLPKNGGTNKITVSTLYDSKVTTQPTSTNSTVTITLNYQQDQGQIVGYPEYVLGDIVQFSGSNWIVIDSSDGNKDYVTLMKEKILTTTELGDYSIGRICTDYDVQDDYYGCTEVGQVKKYNAMAYYWSDQCHADGYVYGIDTYSSYDTSGCSNHNDYEGSKVKEFLEETYINSLGSNNLKEIDGYKIRLITRDELFNKMGYDANNSSANLGFNFYKTENVPAWVYQNFKPEINYVYRYWTMTPGPDSNNVWYINSYGELSGMCIYCIDNGVRPVINLYKSAIGN